MHWSTEALPEIPRNGQKHGEHFTALWILFLFNSKTNLNCRHNESIARYSTGLLGPWIAGKIVAKEEAVAGVEKEMRTRTPQVLKLTSGLTDALTGRFLHNIFKSPSLFPLGLPSAIQSNTVKPLLSGLPIKQTPFIKRTLSWVPKLTSYFFLYNEPLFSGHLYQSGRGR